MYYPPSSSSYSSSSYSNKSSSWCSLKFILQLCISFMCGVIFCIFFNNNIYDLTLQMPMSMESSSSNLITPMEDFQGESWRRPSTLETKIVASTKFARCEVHKVKTENGQIINDWIWTDEREHVNILVHLKNENKYLLFRQSKYGLERPYLALVGGLFNENETALECAIRELLEETGLIAEEMINLGRYRVQVNRGGGILNAFIARNAVPKDGHDTYHQLLSSEQGGDYEKQTIVKLTLNEVIDYALKGEIGEAQWTAVAALGVLYQQNREKNQIK